MDLAVPADDRLKLKESENKVEYLALQTIEKNKQTVEHESDYYTNCNWCSWYRYLKPGGIGNNGTSGDHPNYSIIEIGQNTEKSSGDSKRLAVTQTPVKDHQLTLV